MLGAVEGEVNACWHSSAEPVEQQAVHREENQGNAARLVIQFQKQRILKARPNSACPRAGHRRPVPGVALLSGRLISATAPGHGGY